MGCQATTEPCGHPMRVRFKNEPCGYVEPTLTEQQVLMQQFNDMLWIATGDGAAKRKAGLKEPWWRDTEHEAAIFSHLSKWKHGELVDEHSGAHPLVHVAWRALAIAYQESYGKREPPVWWRS